MLYRMDNGLPEKSKNIDTIVVYKDISCLSMMYVIFGDECHCFEDGGLDPTYVRIFRGCHL